MPASQVTQGKVKAPVLEFDESVYALDETAMSRGIFHYKSILVAALQGRGKSTFLKSVMAHRGKESIVALDIEKRLYQLGVPRVTPPDLTQYDEGEHYARIFKWWDQLLDRAELRAAPFNPQCQVIALDTINTLYDMIYQADMVRHWITRDKPRDQWKYDFTWYSALYSDFLKRWRRMVALTECGYTVIFNCHVDLKHRKVEGEEIDQYELILPPALKTVILREIHVAFYLKANQDASKPNYFVTTASDAFPAKDQTGLLPKSLWPTWAAYEAAIKGEEWSKFVPQGIQFVAKKEEAKK